MVSIFHRDILSKLIKIATTCEITIQTARSAEITPSRKPGSEGDVVMLVNQYVALLHDKDESQKRNLTSNSALL